MIPKFGGPELRLAPICLPKEHYKAKAYLAQIETALLADGWSSGQRRYLRVLHLKWLYRAEGRDPHFEEYGTFGRLPGAPPPTITDLIIARKRQRYKTAGLDAARQAVTDRRFPRHKGQAQQRILERYRRDRAARARERRDQDDD